MMLFLFADNFTPSLAASGRGEVGIQNSKAKSEKSVRYEWSGR